MDEYTPELPPDSSDVSVWAYEELIRLSGIIRDLQAALEEKQNAN